MKFLIVTRLRFRSKSGMQELDPGDIVSFEKDDQVDIEFLLKVGAIRVVKEISPNSGKRKS